MVSGGSLNGVRNHKHGCTSLNGVHVPGHLLWSGGNSRGNSIASSLRGWFRWRTVATTVDTKHDGTAQGQYIYYPWGQQWQTAGSPWANNWAGFDNNYQTWFRNMDDLNGRWLNPDPAGLGSVDITNPQTLNRYAYVTNNPTTLTDPLGLGDCGGDPDFDCNNNGNPPPPPNHSQGSGGGWGDTGGGDCSFTASNDASCAAPAGLWSNWTQMWGPNAGVLGFGGLGGWLGNGMGSGPLSGDYGVGLPPLTGGFGQPCDFGTCGSGVPGANGFAAEAAAVIIAPEITVPVIVVGVAVDAALAYYLYSKGRKQNIVPSWAEGARPVEGESAWQFADRLCAQHYPPDGSGCGNGPGSERSKIRKWARDKFGI